MLFGIALPALVGLLIEILKKVGIVSTGDQARLANLILSAFGALAVSLLGEFGFQAPQIVIVIVAAVYSVVASALGYNLGEKAVERFM
jgi:hypothetical protein